MQAALCFLPDGDSCFPEFSIPEFTFDDLDGLKRGFVIQGLYAEVRGLFEFLETAAHGYAFVIIGIAGECIPGTLQSYLHSWSAGGVYLSPFQSIKQAVPGIFFCPHSDQPAGIPTLPHHGLIQITDTEDGTEPFVFVDEPACGGMVVS